MSKDTNYQSALISYLKRSNLLLSQISDNLTGGASNPPQNLSIDVVEATINGVTDSSVKSVSLIFMGDGGTIDGVSVDEGMGFTFSPTEGQDTVNSVGYTVPTSGDQRIIISYVR